MRTIAFDVRVAETGDAAVLAVVDGAGDVVLCARLDSVLSVGAIAVSLREAISSAEEIICYDVAQNLELLEGIGISLDCERIADAMVEFSEARAVPQCGGGYRTFTIEEARHFVCRETDGLKRGTVAAAKAISKVHDWALKRIESEPDPLRRYRDDLWNSSFERLLRVEFDGKYFERMERESLFDKGRECSEEQAAIYSYAYVAGLAQARCVFEECLTMLVAEDRFDEIDEVDCEEFALKRGIKEAYAELAEKQCELLGISDDRRFLGERRPLFCPECETRMESKTIDVQFGSSANAVTARSIGCHVCATCGRIALDDDDMRAARGYKKAINLAIDGVAGGSITDYGRRNAENYGARWERYYREGYLERYFARLDEALAEAAERGDVAYIANRRAHSQAKAEAEGWVRRKTERWCATAEAIERYTSQGRIDEFEKALEEGRADAILSELGLDGAYAYY